MRLEQTRIPSNSRLTDGIAAIVLQALVRPLVRQILRPKSHQTTRCGSVSINHGEPLGDELIGIAAAEGPEVMNTPLGFRRRSRTTSEVEVLLKNRCSASVCSRRACSRLLVAALLTFTFQLATPAHAADIIEGQVLGAGAPIAKSTVTLWSASADAPKQLAQTQTGDDGRFTLSAEGSPDGIFYIVAKGGVPAANKSGGDNRR